MTTLHVTKPVYCKIIKATHEEIKLGSAGSVRTTAPSQIPMLLMEAFWLQANLGVAQWLLSQLPCSIHPAQHVTNLQPGLVFKPSLGSDH